MKSAYHGMPYITMAVGLVACARNMEHPTIGGSPAAPIVNAIYVLAEGGTTINGVSYYADSDFKSALAFYDLATKTVTPDRFSQVNGFLILHTDSQATNDPVMRSTRAVSRKLWSFWRRFASETTQSLRVMNFGRSSYKGRYGKLVSFA